MTDTDQNTRTTNGDPIEPWLAALYEMNLDAKYLRECRRAAGRRSPEADQLSHEIRKIYDAKVKLLDAFARRGLAEVGRFIEHHPGWRCRRCGNQWKGRNNGCFDCGFRGVVRITEEKVWLSVRVRTYRFHLPGDVATALLHYLAEDCEGHCPAREARALPQNDIDLQASVRTVTEATEMLLGKRTTEAAWAPIDTLGF